MSKMLTRLKIINESIQQILVSGNLSHQIHDLNILQILTYGYFRVLPPFNIKINFTKVEFSRDTVYLGSNLTPFCSSLNLVGMIFLATLHKKLLTRLDA